MRWRRESAPDDVRDSDLQISEWHGNSAFAFAPTGPVAADYVQISLGRELEWRAGHSAYSALAEESKTTPPPRLYEKFVRRLRDQDVCRPRNRSSRAARSSRKRTDGEEDVVMCLRPGFPRARACGCFRAS
ncbi:MAG: hypothetical protein EOR54_22520 [Mesorhizobium sp.]|nr:MAG: hypothetical protein EOR54_22520 [Mesorhizobium sp.]